MATNLHDVKSADEFQDYLSKDLQRVSLINFWAPWAEPCKQMNELVAELAKKYESVLFLQVDAEQLPEISESFDVESVPAFVLLRGHTLLGRVTGADADGLTKQLAIHGKTAVKPTATSDKAPAAPLASVPETNSAAAAPTAPEEKPAPKETQEELEARMRKIMDSDKVVLFMKGSPDAPRCGFSRQTVAILREHKVPFTHFDILQDEAVRQGLKTYNNWPTFPQLIIGGELMGGLDILREMIDNGEFNEALDNVGVVRQEA
ncbi:Monothiol glutaredoxin-4 [Serendipita indica DSM 11827]|uniref:Probable glutaredoxin n=1 Tax=Serendipita indica (strain DSM 11827) TaxID=1109443 RepID=G4TSG2_SERID|nr:Monothiol glutaredoxin-4 [Serendipita indica DSM 11827]CCA74255.1 probable glutaredoxin [Serendipita indica DSM 11827]